MLQVLSKRAGEHHAEAVLSMEDGHVERREMTIDVRTAKYPTRA
jgi:hypothetical protein